MYLNVYKSVYTTGVMYCIQIREKSMTVVDLEVQKCGWSDLQSDNFFANPELKFSIFANRFEPILDGA